MSQFSWKYGPVSISIAHVHAENTTLFISLNRKSNKNDNEITVVFIRLVYGRCLSFDIFSEANSHRIIVSFWNWAPMFVHKTLSGNILGNKKRTAGAMEASTISETSQRSNKRRKTNQFPVVISEMKFWWYEIQVSLQTSSVGYTLNRCGCRNTKLVFTFTTCNIYLGKPQALELTFQLP